MKAFFLFAILFSMILGGLAQAQDDIAIGTEADFEWTAASGPVAKYGVWVMRNNAGWPDSPEQIVPDTKATITGVDGERIEIRVAAQDDAGNQGPFSPRSDKVFFSVAPPPLGEPGKPCRCVLEVETDAIDEHDTSD